VEMADLRAAFEAMGLAEVATYIQSGNVLFRAPRQRREQLAAQIESELSRRFGAELRLVLLTGTQLRAVVAGAPRGFGAEDHKCDVIFLRKPLTASRAISLVEIKEGVDSAWAGKGVLPRTARDEGLEQSSLEARRPARVPADDDPQLGHDDEAARPDRLQGPGVSGAGACGPQLRSPRPPATPGVRRASPAGAPAPVPDRAPGLRSRASPRP
jgi:uncharacterized protein (DUF1697 family)